MTKIFSLIFSYDEANFFCLVKPIVDGNKIDYYVTVKFVEFGFDLQEEYIICQENGQILNEGSESILRKKTTQALKDYLSKRRVFDSVNYWPIIEYGPNINKNKPRKVES